MNRIAARWGDNDTYFGPFTFAKDTTWRPLAIQLSSGDDDGRRCRLRFSGFGRTMLVALPEWVCRAERKWVDTSHYEWSKGKGGYWDIIPREYGFTLSDGHLSVSHGRQTHDSSTEQRWGWFLPWTQWRFVRHSLYGLDGALFADLPPRARWGSPEHERGEALKDACPTATFAFRDYDGEALMVTTKIEERAWKLGEGWFKWLSVFRAQKVRRSLDLRFSGETGKRKGSWKGGTIGHSIEMLPGELHEAAFRRYCPEHDMTFVGPAA